MKKLRLKFGAEARLPQRGKLRLREVRRLPQHHDWTIERAEPEVHIPREETLAHSLQAQLQLVLRGSQRPSKEGADTVWVESE